MIARLAVLSLLFVAACGSSSSAPTSAAGGTGGGSGGFGGGAAGGNDGSAGGSGGSSAGGSGGNSAGGSGGSSAGGSGGSSAGGSGGSSAGGAGGGSAGGSGGGGTVDRPEYTNGSRLRARTMTSSDGARQFLGWRDTQLGLGCQFLGLADGSLRCVPLFQEMASSYATYYADEHCQQPLTIQSTQATCGAPLWGYGTGSNNTCNPEFASEAYRIFHVAGQFTGAQVYTLSGTACTAQQAYTGFTYWTVGSEADYTQFVSGTVATE